MSEERYDQPLKTLLRKWLENNETMPAVDLGVYIGKPAGENGDFDVAYTSATTLTFSNYPIGLIGGFYTSDIEAVRQLNAAGQEVEFYTRDEKAFTVAAHVLTVPGASFTATDIFIVYTNVSKDLEIESNEVDTLGYIGKAAAANGDFDVAYTAATQITFSNYPAGVTAIHADDIECVKQIATGGSVTKIFNREDATMVMAGAVLTVTGAAFVNTDTFVVYTNISRDVEIENTSLDTSGMVGKAAAANGDFDVTYTAATQVTVSNLPSSVAAIHADDIEAIKQIATGGGVTNIFNREDAVMSVAGAVITVAGAAFVNTDTFVVYTNIPKLPTAVDNSAMVATPTFVPAGGEYNATDPTYADGDAAVLQTDSSGRLKTTGGAGVPPYTHSNARKDFTATYTSNVTITLAGEPATVTNNQIAFIIVTDSAGTTVQTFINGVNGVAMSIAASVITITGAGTPFAASDTYNVGLNLFDKAYDISNDVYKVQEQSSNYDHYTDVEHLVDESNQGLTATSDGGDADTLTDSSETFTAEDVAEGYTAHQITDGETATVDADSLYGLAGDGGCAGAGSSVETSVLTGAATWNTKQYSLPWCKRFEIPAEGYNFISIQTLLDSQDGNNSCYCKIYATLDSSADTTDDTGWVDISTDVFGAAHLSADGITAGARTVQQGLYIIDVPTTVLKYMIKIIGENDDGTIDNEFDIWVKKSS